MGGGLILAEELTLSQPEFSNVPMSPRVKVSVKKWWDTAD